jgi:hypothetical protein
MAAEKLFQFETLSGIRAMRQQSFLSGEIYPTRELSGFSRQGDARMRNLSTLSLAALALVSLAVIPAMAQTTPNQPKGTTYTTPSGKLVHTPPRGMRSGTENVGGESGGS